MSLSHTHAHTSLPNRTPVRTPRSHSGAHKGVPSQQHHRHRSLVVSQLPPLLHSRTTPTPNARSVDEAGQYLTAYKQSEHRPPTLIRERIDKTPSALLRTALTSVQRVNKTDAQTLRASFGVRPPPHKSNSMKITGMNWTDAGGAHRASRRSHGQIQRSSRVSQVSALKKSRGSKTRSTNHSAPPRRALSPPLPPHQHPSLRLHYHHPPPPPPAHPSANG
jgi:DNA excision repair protein ERCC-1